LVVRVDDWRICANQTMVRSTFGEPTRNKAYQKAELCVTAKLIVEWQRWVKTSKAQNE